MVQWLRPCALSAGGPGLIPGQGTRSHMPQLKILNVAAKIGDGMCHNQGPAQPNKQINIFLKKYLIKGKKG